MAARLARTEVLYDDCWVHVISRSIRKLEVFKDQEDFDVFCELLINVKLEYKSKIFHYCLMQTHFHLAMRISTVEGFVRAMQKLKSRYVYKFHSKYKLSGPIWRERFRSLLIENESYLYACGQYIENNPGKAGLVSKNTGWKYSSSRYYLRGENDPIVDGYEVIGLPQLPQDVDLYTEESFEKGRVIGSSYFRFRFKEAHKVGKAFNSGCPHSETDPFSSLERHRLRHPARTDENIIYAFSDDKERWRWFRINYHAGDYKVARRRDYG